MSDNRVSKPKFSYCVLVTTGAATLLAGCEGGVLDPQGPIGLAQRTILINSLAIMLAIVIPTIVATIAFAWWFREGNSAARYRPEFVYSGRIELIVWSIPTLVILFLGGIIWIGSHQLDPAKPLPGKPLDIQVVSLDWKWLFIYPGQRIASVNELVVPAGTPLSFSLTSASVMNVFFVPQLGSMIYAMNGMTTRLHLQADRAGEYEGMSAMISGDGFSDMRFKVRAVSGAAFEEWTGKVKQGGPALDAAAYRALARQGVVEAPVTYRDVEPSLFDSIARQKIAPSSGPRTGQPNPETSPRAGG